MVLTRAMLEGYDRRLADISEAAGKAAARAYDEARARNLNASVSEVRETAIAVVESALYSYGDLACEEAASLYDDLASEAGADVPAAVLPEVDDDTIKVIDRQMRYAVGALVGEGEREDI